MTDPQPPTPAEAGPALDAEVCRLVFGREVVPCADTIHFPTIGCPVWRYRVRSEEEPDFISSEPGIPLYSTDWRAAGLLINHFPRVVVSKHPDCFRAFVWPAWGMGPWDPEGFMAEAETGPEAICRAALSAVLAARAEPLECTGNCQPTTYDAACPYHGVGRLPTVIESGRSSLGQPPGEGEVE